MISPPALKNVPSIYATRATTECCTQQNDISNSYYASSKLDEYSKESIDKKCDLRHRYTGRDRSQLDDNEFGKGHT